MPPPSGYFTWIFLCCCYFAAQTNVFAVEIQNGFDASEAETPYVVSLEKPNSTFHFCSGAIVSETWVLTAAHCTLSKSFDKHIQVSTGYNNQWRSVHLVTRIRRHERFLNFKSFINDIALLEVTPPFVFNEFVRPVKLPEPQLYIPTGTRALFAAWGTTTYPNVRYPKRLQKLIVTIVAENYCNKRYHTVARNIYRVHLCTIYAAGNFPRGACTGDSGGPLTINNGTIVGIASWSHKNGSCGTYPNVYTRISEYLDWINENMSRD